jgi:hypothetical protein
MLLYTLGFCLELECTAGKTREPRGLVTGASFALQNIGRVRCSDRDPNSEGHETRTETADEIACTWVWWHNVVLLSSQLGANKSFVCSSPSNPVRRKRSAYLAIWMLALLCNWTDHIRVQEAGNVTTDNSGCGIFQLIVRKLCMIGLCDRDEAVFHNIEESKGKRGS